MLNKKISFVRFCKWGRINQVPFLKTGTSASLCLLPYTARAIRGFVFSLKSFWFWCIIFFTANVFLFTKRKWVWKFLPNWQSFKASNCLMLTGRSEQPVWGPRWPGRIISWPCSALCRNLEMPCPPVYKPMKWHEAVTRKQVVSWYLCFKCVWN